MSIQTMSAKELAVHLELAAAYYAMGAATLGNGRHVAAQQTLERNAQRCKDFGRALENMQSIEGAPHNVTVIYRE